MTVRSKLLSCRGDFDAKGRGHGKKLVVGVLSQGG